LDFANGFSSVGPSLVGLGGKVTLCEVGLNGGNQFLDARKAAISNTISSKISKKSLYHIHPRTARWVEVHVEPRSFCRPSLNLGMFVCAVVVDYEMKVEIGGHFAINLFEKAQPLPAYFQR